MSIEFIDAEEIVSDQPETQNGIIKVDFDKLPVNLKVSDIEINRLKEFMSLTIIDINDITGYNVVDLRRKEVKKIRTSLVKYAKQLREPAKVFCEKVIAEERRITAELEAIETNLENKQRFINDEKEKIRIEEEKKAAEKLQARVNTFSKYTVAEINLDYLKALSDADFESVIAEMKAAWEKAEEEKSKAAEELKKQQEENERLRKELEAQKKDAEVKKEPEVITDGNFYNDTILIRDVSTPAYNPLIDKEKLINLFNALSSITIPKIESAELQKVVFDANAHIGKAIQLLKKAINK